MLELELEQELELVSGMYCKKASIWVNGFVARVRIPRCGVSQIFTAMITSTWGDEGVLECKF
jgi:hypothetical protein